MRQHGNPYQNITVKIDKTYPTINSVSYSVLSPTSVKIKAGATDPGCGTTGTCVQTLYYYYNSATNGTNSGAWNLLGSSAGASGSYSWNTVGIPAGNHLVAVDPQDYAGNRSLCLSAGSNTCPNTFTIHTLTAKNTKKAGVVLGSVKLTTGLSPNPCKLQSCLYTGLPHGSSVKFTEKPKSGHTFVRWVVNGVNKTHSSITVTISGNTTVQAVYK